jgi:hypothetical protein
MIMRIAIVTLPVLITAIASASLRGGGDYDLWWNSIDGGAGVASGDEYQISGTIGQADAGVTLTGGVYTFIGGFWAAGGDTIVPPPCPADLDGDGVVNVIDLLQLLGAWGTADPTADINGDGIVNVLDLLELLAAWGTCP